MQEAIQQYTNRLTNALVDEELDAKLSDLVGNWTHPYLRTIPPHFSVSDVRQLRRLQNRMVEGRGRFDGEQYQLLTAGRIELGNNASREGIPASKMAKEYSQLPELERTQNRLKEARAEANRIHNEKTELRNRLDELEVMLRKLNGRRDDLKEDRRLFGLSESEEDRLERIQEKQRRLSGKRNKLRDESNEKRAELQNAKARVSEIQDSGGNE